MKTTAVRIGLIGLALMAACGGDGGGGGSAGSGGSGGGGGSGGSGVSSSTPVPNCSTSPTVGAVESNIIKPSCATTTGCHTGGSAYGDYTKGLASFVGEKAFLFCTGLNPTEYAIDPATPEHSLMYTIIASTTPKCNDGTDVGSSMPFNLPLLAASDIACIQSYVKVLAAGK